MRKVAGKPVERKQSLEDPAAAAADTAAAAAAGFKVRELDVHGGHGRRPAVWGGREGGKASASARQRRRGV